MNLKLKEIRLIRGISQQKVTNYLHCSVVCYSRYETGNRCPSLELLIQMAEFFDVTIDYLLGRQQISEQGLTSYETSLIDTAQKADDRAREDAMQLLQLHSTDGTM